MLRPQPQRMNTIYYDTWRRGGTARTFELLGDGHTSHQLTAAVRRGEILRLRQGHYGCPELAVPEQQAVRVGGRLTGVPGAERHGVWVPHIARLAVAVPKDARALRSPTDKSVRLAALRSSPIKVHWTDPTTPGTRTLVGIVGCLLEIARTQQPRVTFAAIESALYLGKLTRAEWRRAAAGLPRAKRRPLESVGRSSESGGESLAKFEFLAAAIPFVQQVVIAGVGRVDFLVGERLVVEIDGAEFHASRESFEDDRRRDALLRALGYRVLRFSYQQVWSRPREFMTAVVTAIASGDHLASA